MGQFSRSKNPLTSAEESGLSLEIKDSLALLRHTYPSSNIRCYNYDDEVAIAMDLKIAKPNRAVLFNKIEPVLLKLNKKNYPFSAPKFYSDRTDFPSENIPHINPVTEGQPYWICLFRGSADDWYAQHNIVDAVERLRTWLSDAAAYNLNKTGDDFEQTRVDKAGHFLMFPEKDAIDKIKNYWKNNNSESGYFILLNFQEPDLEPHDFSKKRFQRQIVFLDSDFEELEKRQKNFKDDENGIAGLVFFSAESDNDDRYITRLPSNLKELTEWASYRKINLKIVLEDFISSPLKKNSIIPIVFAIKRPRKVINHLSDLEFISFFIFPTLAGDKYEFQENSIVDNASLIQKNSLALAARLSGYPADVEYNDMHYIGLGAVGSKIALHFAKSGILPKSLIDPDISLPHNNIRNGLINLFGLKIDKLESDIKLMYHDDPITHNITKFPETILNVLENNKNLLSNNSSIIVDSTASFGVENLLVKKLNPASARYARVELTEKGDIGFLRVDGASKNPRMDDLMMEVYSQALNDQKLSEWLIENKESRTQHSDLDEIYLGLNCSSDTLIMPDDKVSLHGAAASVGLRSVLHNKIENGLIQITHLTDKIGLQTNTKIYEIQPVLAVQCDNQPQWQLRFKHSLEELLLNELNTNRPNETGGIFIGRINQSAKIIYVTQIITAPPDSVKSAYYFTRGIEGLTSKVDEIRNNSGGMLDYVGEWHTHPSGSAKLSLTDRDAIRIIRKELDPIRYPTCVTIINGTKIHPYIFTDYE